MTHSDVWGHNRTCTLSNKKWFITFTDDHTRLCWVYLLKEKSKVGKIIQNFCKLVQAHFNTQIQVFRTYNGTEFFNKIVGNVFIENGIVHQSSCGNSPKQNGILERKNRHLIEVARALLFFTNVPKYL